MPKPVLSLRTWTELSGRQIDRVAGNCVGALEVPAKADGHDGGVGQPTGTRFDRRALKSIVDGDRKQHLQAVKASKDLLAGDDAEPAAGGERGDARIARKRLAVRVLHLVRVVEVEERGDDIDIRRRLGSPFESDCAFDVLRIRCA
jgi:hypothetical protein